MTQGAAGIDGVPMVESSLRRYYLPRELLTGGEVPSEASVPLPDEAEYVRMVGAGADHVRLLGLTADAGTLSFRVNGSPVLEALTGFPVGAALRPHAFGSRPGDRVCLVRGYLE